MILEATENAIRITVGASFYSTMKTHIKQLLDTKNTTLYTRYEDDILIIYDTTKIQPHINNTQINQIHDNIKLNPTHETNKSINFLDLTITRQQTNLEIDIRIQKSNHHRHNNQLSL